MHLSKLVLGLGFALTTITNASAAKITLDYRHDYRTELGQHYDRFNFIVNLDNGIGFYVNSSLKSSSQSPTTTDANGVKHQHPEWEKNRWGDFAANVIETSLWYTYKIPQTKFTISPGIITESTTSATGYKPYFRVQYNTDFGLWLALRTRYDYWRYDSKAQDTKNLRLDTYVGYKYKGFGVSYNYTYIKALNDLPNGDMRTIYDGDDYNYEHNVVLDYSTKQWRPYMEIGDIADPYGTGRQGRIRLGVRYTF